jgi:hypothetical protein
MLPLKILLNQLSSGDLVLLISLFKEFLHQNSKTN